MIDAVAEDERMSQAVHRVDVIRRLLEAGLSAATLRAMLPELTPVIDELVGSTDAEHPRRLASTSR